MLCVDVNAATCNEKIDSQFVFALLRREEMFLIEVLQSHRS